MLLYPYANSCSASINSTSTTIPYLPLLLYYNTFFCTLFLLHCFHFQSSSIVSTIQSMQLYLFYNLYSTVYHSTYIYVQYYNSFSATQFLIISITLQDNSSFVTVSLFLFIFCYSNSTYRNSSSVTLNGHWTVSRDFWPVLLIRFDLGPIWTGKKRFRELFRFREDIR